MLLLDENVIDRAFHVLFSSQTGRSCMLRNYSAQQKDRASSAGKCVAQNVLSFSTSWKSSKGASLDCLQGGKAWRIEFGLTVVVEKNLKIGRGL